MSHIILREVYRDKQTLVAEVPAIAWVAASRAEHLILPHAHSDLYEISFFTRGSADWWVGGQTYHVTAGWLFVTRPGEEHGAQDEMFHPHEHWQIQLRLPAAASSSDGNAFPWCGLAQRLAQIERHCFPGSPEIEQHMRRILLEHRHPGEFSPLVIRAAVCEMIVAVLRDYERACQLPVLRHGSRWLQPLLDWIDTALPEIDSARCIAEHAGLSVRQFYRLFKQALKVTPNEYLTERRIEAAKRLLAEDRLSITRIAFQVGFSSSQYFSTFFRTHTGVTPTRFRRNCRSQADAKPGEVEQD